MNLYRVEGFDQIVHGGTTWSSFHSAPSSRVIVYEKKHFTVMEFMFPLPSHKDHRQQLYLADQLISYQSLPQGQQPFWHLILNDDSWAWRFIKKHGSKAPKSVFPRSVCKDQDGSWIDSHWDGTWFGIFQQHQDVTAPVLCWFGHALIFAH